MLRLALDAGHGRNTRGKRCLKSLDPKETREWELNSRVISYVIALLIDNDDIDITRLDDPEGNADVSLEERCDLCNASNCNLLISIHHNAGINGGTGGGVSVLFYPTKDNDKTARTLYDSVVSYNGMPGDRACKTVIRKDLALLKNTRCPAFILENGFMDSYTDVPVILTEEHAKLTADGVVKFILEYSMFHGYFDRIDTTKRCPHCNGIL